METIVSGFHWTAMDVRELDTLGDIGNQTTLLDKTCCHLCYLTESVYVLAIEPMHNLSSNPVCKWQLKIMGNGMIVRYVSVHVVNINVGKYMFNFSVV